MVTKEKRYRTRDTLGEFRRMSCEWVFLAAEGARITINVSFFESEEFTDELKIYAGTNRSTKELTR